MALSVLPVVYFLALLGWQYVTHVQTRSPVALPASLAFADHAALAAAKVAPVLPFLPELPSSWLASLEAWPPVHLAVLLLLERLHVGLVVAAPALLTMALGALIVYRQAEKIRVEKRREDDRHRRMRVGQYGGAAERIEPFIGQGLAVGTAEEPSRKRQAA
jgi:hypothetical protein